VIVRWGLDHLGRVLGEAGVERPVLVRSERWSALDLPAHALWTEVPSDRVDSATRAAEGADGVLAVGGGSAIDLGKAISAATGLALVSVPTTYSGSEWTAYFGVRDPDRRMRGGGAGAHPTGIVYEADLTLDLPRAETVGTALNALAHCAEALYVRAHNDEADRHALAGARLIAEHLPRVVETPHDVEERAALLRGAAEAGEALAGSMLALGHAMAQALGGRYGLPHGAMNALCLSPALRFNAAVAPDSIRSFGKAIGAEDPAERVEELAQLGGFERLRDFGVPEDELDEVAAAAAGRAGARANPRPASAAEIAGLLRSIW
jgi:maleylacetate reductase